MDNKDKFVEWMRSSQFKAKNSVDKYSGAVGTISDLMLDQQIINIPIFLLSFEEFERVESAILSNENFIQKNTKGNNMYSVAIKHYRRFLHDLYDNEDLYSTDISSIHSDNTITKTEKEQLIKARIGQGQYREQLLDKYDHKCIVTGLQNSRVLVASHIKPWAVCSNAERLDQENGLLLSATYDRLFDSGLISFKDNGQILVSKTIQKQDVKILGLDNKDYYDLKVNKTEYLEYHRDVLFIK